VTPKAKLKSLISELRDATNKMAVLAYLESACAETRASKLIGKSKNFVGRRKKEHIEGAKLKVTLNNAKTLYEDEAVDGSLDELIAEARKLRVGMTSQATSDDAIGLLSNFDHGLPRLWEDAIDRETVGLKAKQKAYLKNLVRYQGHYNLARLLGTHVTQEEMLAWGNDPKFMRAAESLMVAIEQAVDLENMNGSDRTRLAACKARWPSKYHEPQAVAVTVNNTLSHPTQTLDEKRARRLEVTSQIESSKS